MYRLTSPNHLRALAAAAAATTYSSRCCLAEPPPSPLTEDFVNVAEKVKILGETLPQNAYTRKVLEIQSENVALLTCESSAAGGICNVYLIGTRHDSRDSRREVEAVIEFLKPEVVVLELCANRLTAHKPTIDGEIIDERRVVSGNESEFTVAYNQAMQYGAKVIPGDRPIEITKKRMEASISYWELIKSMYYNRLQLESIMADLVTSLSSAMNESIHERDQYMSAKILEVAREHNSVVVVVGKAHLPGIQKNWKQPVELERLLSLPTEKNLNPYILGSVGAGVAAGAVIIFRRLSKK